MFGLKQPTITAPGAVTLAVAVLAIDQAAKQWAVSTLNTQPQPYPGVLGGRLSLVYTANRGAAFGVLAGGNSLFIALALLVVAAILASLAWFPARRWPTPVSLALMLGGAAGNLADRVHYGYVVDFIYFRPLPVFNLADTAITGGTFLLAWTLLSPASQPRRGSQEKEPVP
jgi:signal peptidase II